MDFKDRCSIFVVILFIASTNALTCDKLTACKCKMSDGSGEIDLTSLEGKNGQPRFKDVKGTENPDPLQYSWNPCTPFNEGDEYGCQKVAVCQVYSFTSVSGGSQDSAKFVVDGGGTVSVQYSESYTNSIVDLICDKNAKDPVFTAIGDPQSTNTIKLSLKHACSCPGMCDDSGVINDGGGGGGGLSTGTILIITFIVLLIIYIIGGIIYNVKVRQETGVKILPNATFWMYFPLYVKDGCKFTAEICVNLRSKSYQEI